jgi:serine phosphatase RsbU (regulator of sigma subunit)
MSSGRSASELVDGTLEAIRNHAGGNPQSDDITIVAVHA